MQFYKLSYLESWSVFIGWCIIQDNSRGIQVMHFLYSSPSLSPWPVKVIIMYVIYMAVSAARNTIGMNKCGDRDKVEWKVRGLVIDLIIYCYVFPLWVNIYHCLILRKMRAWLMLRNRQRFLKIHNGYTIIGDIKPVGS